MYPRRSISELDGVRRGSPSAAFRRLWLEEEVRIEVLEALEALEVMEEVEELEDLNPPRVKDFSRSCCVLVVATRGFGDGEG